VSTLKIITLTYPISLNDIELNDQSFSIALGHFDGVHRGHQQVIHKAIQTAKERGIASAVMTFHPHPKAILGQGEQYYHCLTPLDTKLRLFQELGVDYVFVVSFDMQFSAITPHAFVEEILKKLSVVNVVAGFDFRFGAKGAGNTEVLKELCASDISVEVVEAFEIDGIKVSSTVIREYLEQGQIEQANHLLGRRFSVEGTVVTGDQRGRTIGFPTANLLLAASYVTISLGVYAVKAYLGNRRFHGVLNHGMKPTFNKDDIVPVMEAHLFDFSEDIYGEHMQIEFVSFIRKEQRFSGIQQLIEQIGQDAAQAKELLARN